VDITTTRPEGAHAPRLLTVPLANASPGAEGLIWGVAKEKDAGPMAAARVCAIEAAKDEYRRLLYVGLTRAAEQLVVCGVKGEKKIPQGCWHELVLDALKPLSTETDTAEGKVWHFCKVDRGAATVQASSAPPPRQPLPGWLRHNAAPEPHVIHTITPSAALEDEANRPPAGGDRQRALLRGTLMHRLLQSLPDTPAKQRAEIAEKFLARAGRALPDDERRTMLSQALALLGSAEFATLFGPNSRAEVSIVGSVQHGGKTVRVSGQVDRLAVTKDAVLIADFKTNRPAPRIEEDVPKSYRGQLALYRAVLAKLYPDRPIRAALIWTEVPDLMELSVPVLDAALAQVTSA